MRREYVFPLVIGVILGALLMLFWQFNSRLNNAANALAQLQQVSSQNTQAVNEVVSFINQATGGKQTTTPEANK